MRERNALADRLRAEGRAEAAREVAMLPKPTVAVWAINHVAHRNRHAVTAFLRTVEGWRKAYARGSAGVPAATEAERRALEAVLAAATNALDRAGERVTPDVVRRIANTLRAAAANRASAEALRRGRVTTEAELSGFELVPGVRRQAPAATPRRDRDVERGRVQRGLISNRAETGAESGRQAASTRDAARRARALERRAARHRRAADAAEREAVRLRARLQTLEARAASERAAAERASAEARGDA